MTFHKIHYPCGFYRKKLPHFATRHISLKNEDIDKCVLKVSKSSSLNCWFPKSNLEVGHSPKGFDPTPNHFTLCVGGFVGFCFKLSQMFQGVTFFKKRLYRMHKQWPN